MEKEKQWFKYKENSAGEKRLILTWFIFKHFGEIPVRIIAFFVAIITFLKAKEQRKAVEKFFKILNTKKEPAFLSAFKTFFSYANSLVDKMIAFGGKFNTENFIFEENNDKTQLEKFLKAKKGAFFISTHIGNVEIMRVLLHSEKYKSDTAINVFLQKNMCEIFNKFLEHIQIKENIKTFPVEDIDVETSIKMSENLTKGEFVFMAGDRVSAQNTNACYTEKFLGKNVKFPLGTLKFALMMNYPIFFVVCAKKNKNYIIHLKEFSSSKEKNEKLDEIKKEYIKFLEKYTLLYPYQSYNFFDIFED